MKKALFHHNFNPFVIFLIRAICVISSILLWEFLVSTQIIASFILPSPTSILQAIIKDFSILLPHIIHTLYMTILGIIIAIIVSFLFAILMEQYKIITSIVYPIILIFQIVPIIIFAPILIIWFGYSIFTQLFTIVLMVFFPMLITLRSGFSSVENLHITMFKTMGANTLQIYKWLKIPVALSHLFSGLRLAVTYGMTASVISEWVGTLQGLGVIMMRSQKSFLVARVFAINLIIICLTLLLYTLIIIIEKKLLPWKKYL